MADDLSPVHPRRFFAEQEPSLWSAAVVVYVGMVATLAGGGLGIEVMTGAAGFPTLLGVAAYLSVVSLAGWTFVTYAVTSAVAGSGSFSRTGAYVGWASVPLAVAGAVNVGITAMVVGAGVELRTVAGTPALPREVALLTAAVSAVAYVGVGWALRYAVPEVRDVGWLTATTLAVGTVVFGVLQALSSPALL